MKRYSTNIRKSVIGLDVALLVLTAYQVFLVVRANSTFSYETVFYFWALGFVGAAILTCALRYKIVTLFAVPFFLPALWFIVACLIGYAHYPESITNETPLFLFTMLFFMVYIGFLVLSVYMGVKYHQVKEAEEEIEQIEDVSDAAIQ